MSFQVKRRTMKVKSYSEFPETTKEQRAQDREGEC